MCQRKASAVLGLCVLGAFWAEPGLARRVQLRHATEEFSVRDRAPLGRIEIEIPDSAGAKPARAAVSDVMLVLAAPGGDVRAVLESRNGGGGSDTLNVRLFVVAGGRLYHQASARCTAFSNDVAACTADCGGGEFSLRRAGSSGLELVLTAGAVHSDTGTRAGIALAACRLDESGDLRLVVKAGLAQAVVRLEAEAE